MQRAERNSTCENDRVRALHVSPDKGNNLFYNITIILLMANRFLTGSNIVVQPALAVDGVNSIDLNAALVELGGDGCDEVMLLGG